MILMKKVALTAAVILAVGFFVVMRQGRTQPATFQPMNQNT